MIWYRALCVGDASERRHDHANGTLITLPSTKYAVIVSDVIVISRIRASTLTTVLIPCLHNLIEMDLDPATNIVQFLRGKTLIGISIRSP
jgi:hypothetical protein